MLALTQVKNEVTGFSLEEQISLLEYLVQAIKSQTTPQPKAPKRYFGCAKGELHYPNDIDFCNDEIAEMFGVKE